MKSFASFLLSRLTFAIAVCALGSLAAASDLPNANGRPPLHIMIDPGHGGSDTGASRGTLKESEIALKVSLQLAEILRQDPRFKVSLTRSRDAKVPLAARTRLAEQAKAEVFLSIHLNSSPDPHAHGTEIYFQNQLPADEESMFLVSRESAEDGDAVNEKATSADSSDPLSPRTDVKRILEDLHHNHSIELSSEFGKTLLETLMASSPRGRMSNRSIRQAPFRVVSFTHMPSVLVELGFITNATEGPRLALTAYQLELARHLHEALVKFKETLDIQSAETLKSQTSATAL